MPRSISRALKSILAFSLVCILTQASHAETILKLNMGNDSVSDLAFDGMVLGTVDDTIAGTAGDQNTSVNFLNFLAATPDITTSIASFTLDDLAASGAAVDIGGVVVQGFSGGSFELYDDSNALLLSADLSTSATNHN